MESERLRCAEAPHPPAMIQIVIGGSKTECPWRDCDATWKGSTGHSRRCLLRNKSLSPALWSSSQTKRCAGATRQLRVSKRRDCGYSFKTSTPPSGRWLSVVATATMCASLPYKTIYGTLWCNRSADSHHLTRTTRLRQVRPHMERKRKRKILFGSPQHQLHPK